MMSGRGENIPCSYCTPSRLFPEWNWSPVLLHSQQIQQHFFSWPHHSILHIGHKECRTRTLFQTGLCLRHTLEPNPTIGRNSEHEPAEALKSFCEFYRPSQTWFWLPNPVLTGKGRQQQVLSSRELLLLPYKFDIHHKVLISRSDRA